MKRNTFNDYFVDNGNPKSLSKSFFNFLLPYDYLLHQDIVDPLRGGIKMEKGRTDVIETLRHEIKHLATSFSNSWITKLDDYFDIKVGELGGEINENKIGQLIIYKKRNVELMNILKNDFAIFPFKHLFLATGALLKLWTLDQQISDAYFIEFDKEDDRKPKTINKFITNCFYRAINILIINGFIDEPLKDKDLIYQKIIFDQVHGVYNKPEISGVTFPIDWGKGNRSTVSLARLFLSIFINFIKHGDPIGGIQIEIKKVNDLNSYEFIVINRRLDLEAFEGMSDVNLNIEDRNEIILNGIERIKIQSSTIFCTKDILNSCLKEMGGVLLKPDPWPQRHEEVTNHQFILSFRIKYGGI